MICQRCIDPVISTYAIVTSKLSVNPRSAMSCSDILTYTARLLSWPWDQAKQCALLHILAADYIQRQRLLVLQWTSKGSKVEKNLTLNNMTDWPHSIIYFCDTKSVPSVLAVQSQNMLLI